MFYCDFTFTPEPMLLKRLVAKFTMKFFFNLFLCMVENFTMLFLLELLLLFYITNGFMDGKYAIGVARPDRVPFKNAKNNYNKATANALSERTN